MKITRTKWQESDFSCCLLSTSCFFTWDCFNDNGWIFESIILWLGICSDCNLFIPLPNERSNALVLVHFLFEFACMHPYVVE